MSSPDAAQLRRQHCEAARIMSNRFGSGPALAFLVGEKLVAFAEAAEQSKAYSAELPAFIAAVRTMFPSSELEVHLDRMEIDERELDKLVDEQPISSSLRETPPQRESRWTRFYRIKELLLADQLGTS